MAPNQSTEILQNLGNLLSWQGKSVKFHPIQNLLGGVPPNHKLEAIGFPVAFCFSGVVQFSFSVHAARLAAFGFG